MIDSFRLTIESYYIKLYHNNYLIYLLRFAGFISGVFMKPKMFFSVFLLFFFVIPFSFGAGDKQAAAISGPSVFFPSAKYEFAPVAEGIIVRHNFIVQNKGDKTLHINKIRTG